MKMSYRSINCTAANAVKLMDRQADYEYMPNDLFKIEPSVAMSASKSSVVKLQFTYLIILFCVFLCGLIDINQFKY